MSFKFIHFWSHPLRSGITFSVTLLDVDVFCLCRKTDLYSAVNDEGLDRSVSEVHRRHPNTGYKLMHGFMNARGVRVPSEK